MICGVVSGIGRPHQVGPLVFTSAHARSHQGNSFLFLKCYGQKLQSRNREQGPFGILEGCSEPPTLGLY
jgi:hypothetical protein